MKWRSCLINSLIDYCCTNKLTLARMNALLLWVHMCACVHKGDLMFQFTNIPVLESSWLSSGVSIETSGVSLGVWQQQVRKLWHLTEYLNPVQPLISHLIFWSFNDRHGFIKNWWHRNNHYALLDHTQWVQLIFHVWLHMCYVYCVTGIFLVQGPDI